MVVDMLDHLLTAKSVSLGPTNLVSGDFKETSVTVYVSSISPALLELISRTLENMPVSLNTLQFSIADGQMSGTYSCSWQRAD
jgi:hypothetical protein